MEIKPEQNIKELQKQGKYIYRYKKLVLNSLPVESTPQRKQQNITDTFDYIFESKDKFNEWYKDISIGFAELDQCLNYCKFFKRIKGNIGEYVRDGKTFKVVGTWCGTQDFGSKFTKGFEFFLKENGWENNWYDLMDKYKTK